MHDGAPKAAWIKVTELEQKIGRKVILDRITFAVEAGEWFGVFGTRGTGKTTLLHTLAGMMRYRTGQVEVLGCNLRKTEAFKRCLGVVTQEPSLFRDLRVLENLDFIATLKRARRPDIIRVIDQFELTAFLQQPLDFLETGIYQRLALACALVNSPKVLIVDDLLNGIDLYSQQLLVRETRNFVAAGGTCIWGFSQIEQCSWLHRVGWLENGRLAVTDPQSLVNKWQQQLETLSRAGDERHV